ncbi:DNA G:T-mismatch repair endonuclease [Brevibacterium casei]|uniref:DNA G:T-mismatch repair endonuclease n=2 Tax=Brevibacterium casei TaxID=33889 RepID=A0A449CZH7_9MICO|nr:DNA G:T-mismatch repair endonuclease [Brevibacterium casei]
MPKTNTDYWSTKISRNAARDTSVNRTLKDAGWTVMRVWEHEDSNVAADRIETAWRQAAR